MFRRIRPVAVKELRQLVRDKRTLAVLLAFPAFLMILFGYAFNFDVKHIRLAVLDQDRTSESRQFIQSFLNSEYFTLYQELNSAEEIDELLNKGRVLVAIVIPADFTSGITMGKNVRVQVIVDGSNSNTASTAVGYVTGVVQNYSSRLLTDVLMRYGRSHGAVPIDYRPRVWYNPELRSTLFLIPGIIVITLLLMSVVSTSLSVVREKERGTMEQIIVSPIRPLDVILGKTIPYAIFSLLGSVIVLLVSALLFNVWVKGNWLLLYLATFFFLMGGLGLGLLISTLTSTQQGAYSFSGLLTMMPSVILSGWIFPIRNMPIPIQVVTYLIPARYFLPILRGIIVKGVGLSAYWEQMLFLVAFATIIIFLSTMRLRRQMS
jgi:drug efflux transport system permease protein